MVILIEQLHELKKYKIETLYTAMSLADRHLAKLHSEGRNLPCLISLATVCLLMAAKLEENMGPSFCRMVDIVNEQYSVVLKREKLVNLEEDVIRTLDFDLRTVSSIQFLERFLRLFGLDMEDSKTSRQVVDLTMQYCRFMQRESCFLPFKPSHLAAASMLFSLNFSASKLVEDILKVKQIPEAKLHMRMKETLDLHYDTSSLKEDANDGAIGPLSWWNNSIQKLT